MSPDNAQDGAEKLTRKEIRARERARLEAEAEVNAANAAPAEREPYAEPVHHDEPPAAVHQPYDEPARHFEPDHGEPQHYADPVPHVEPEHNAEPEHYYEPARAEAEHYYVPDHENGHGRYYAQDDLHDQPVHPDAGHHVYDDTHHDEDQNTFLGARAVPAPSRKVRVRRRLLALLLTLAVFVTAIVVGVQFLRPLLGSDGVSDYPGPGTGQVQVAVDPGEGTRSFAAKLEDARVVADAATFEGAFAASGQTLSPGEYSFRQEMKNADVIAVLAGEESAKVVYFALNAGLRINESLVQIADGAGVNFSDLEALSNQPAQFGLPPAAKNLEGYLAPGEYRFEIGTPAKEILQELVNVTVNELVAQGITDPAKQYDTVIVASIVQAEGGLADYSNVAGAIYNRLEPNDETNGYLQVDSAVTYGLGTKSFNFTDEQRADKSNPYNTYANPGLPVGPIGSPGKTAIDAAAKPAANDYLYWVTINLDSKETKFSSTLAEHNGYVEQYNAWCRANAGRCT